MKHERSARIDGPAGENGEIKLAISSEAPYERWFGIEILGHGPGECDLSRLGDGRHPLLLNHDTDEQVGVITSAQVDSDRVLRGTAKFSRSEDGQEIYQDVVDGIRTLVSVGYMVDEMVEVVPDGNGGYTAKRTLPWAEFEAEQRALHGDNFYRAGPKAARAAGEEALPVFRVTKWTPFEASLVAVPADTTVGVGRAAGQAEVKQVQEQTLIHVQENRKMTTEKDGGTIERERVSAIVAIGEQYTKYVSQKDIADACRNGHSVEQFKDKVMDAMQSRHTDTREAQLGMAPKEVRRYSLGRAILAATTGDWSQAGFERECSQAMAKILGQSPEGFFVPNDVWRRDFNVGTTTEAGNLVPTMLRDDLFVDVLRNNLVVGQAGVRILTGLTGNIDIPRKSVASTLANLTEIGSASETQPNTAKLTLSPKRIGAYVEVSKQALIQSAMPLEAMIRDDLIQGAAVRVEDQFLNGSGTAPNVLGIRNYTTIGTVAAGANGAAPVWANFVDLESACANSNAEPDRLAAYILNTRTRGKLKQTQKGTNLPFIWDNGATPLNGYRVLVTNNMPNNLTKGTSTTICSAALFSSDWSMAVLGLFGAPDIVVDPFTKADTGQVKITLNQFVDGGIRQPGAFAKIEDLLSN